MPSFIKIPYIPNYWIIIDNEGNEGNVGSISGLSERLVVCQKGHKISLGIENL